MPRRPRYILPGQPQHVTVRGVNRTSIFHNDGDYQYYLMRLQDALQKYQCALHTYVLMTNHVHLLITSENESGIAKSMQDVGRTYVPYFNKSYNRTGTLWEGRYHCSPVDTVHYLLACYRYIELNPVRAKMTPDPASYPWSSYRHNAVGHGNSLVSPHDDGNSLVSPHDEYLALGKSGPEQQKAYRALFDTEIEPQTLAEIRTASKSDWVIGSEEFKNEIQRKLNCRTDPKPRGGDRKSRRYRAGKAISGKSNMGSVGTDPNN